MKCQPHFAQVPVDRTSGIGEDALRCRDDLEQGTLYRAVRVGADDESDGSVAEQGLVDDNSEPEPPIILHYNVRLHGDKITEDPVIVQNTWTVGHEWGEEERCPSPSPKKNKKVDDLDQCNEKVGKSDSHVTALHSSASGNASAVLEGTKRKSYFPFKKGHLFVATLRVGSEGIQMTVDGKHITSFEYREVIFSQVSMLSVTSKIAVNLRNLNSCSCLACLKLGPCNLGLSMKLRSLES